MSSLVNLKYKVLLLLKLEKMTRNNKSKIQKSRPDKDFESTQSRMQPVLPEVVLVLVEVLTDMLEVFPPVEGPITPKNNEVLPPLSQPQKEILVGRWLAHYAPFWQIITSNHGFLSIIKRGPIQQPPSKGGSGGKNYRIPRILLQNFYSLKKKNRKLRLIVDLSTLNKYILIQGFRMETQKKVRNFIQHNDWAFSLDLTDACLHVLIYLTSGKYVRCTLKDKILQLRALLLGLSTSPFVFTQLMMVITKWAGEHI